MRDSKNAFHLAIPCKDLQKAVDFYEGKLGFKNHRRYEDRVTFNMLGDQLVCHLAPEKIETDPEPYPRHFGITFYKQSDFDTFVSMLMDNEVQLLNSVFTRFEDKPEAHQAFFLKDPSNNILEFKFYPNSEMMH